MLDRDFNILSINNVAAKLFAGARKTQNFERICRIPQLLGKIGETFSTGAASHIRLDMKNRNGRVYRASVSPAREEGRVAYAVVLISDETELLRLERVRSDFVANVSHELKTPLTSIKGFAELIQTGMVTDEKKVDDYLLRIGAESERLIALIDDILRLSELENIDRAKLLLARVDLGDLAVQTAGTLESQASDRGVSIRVEGSGIIRADAERIRELLINLVDNAVKYNRPGGHVWVNISGDEKSVRLSVKDDGIGIPLEHQDRIFERFYRVDKGRSRKSGSTGLGLAIVKHTAELYGAAVSLSSEEDRGHRGDGYLPGGVKRINRYKKA